MPISRRVFVKAGGVALASLGLDPLFLPRAALATDRRTLVCLFQRGAVDGLSVIVPHGDPIYYRERPRIAVPAGDVIDLDGYFGLHPSLGSLKPLWDDRSLAVVHAVGSPHPTTSHVEAQKNLFHAVAFGTRAPRILAGPAPSLAIRELHLGEALHKVAELIKANAGLEIAFVEAGGWDTHMNQGASEGRLAARLKDLGDALAAFARDLGERLRDVAVVTMSEFGRTIRENGAGGTDHGRATAALVLGGPVHGGRVLGRWPGLDPADRLDGPGLAVTTDFRDLLGEILARHLGAPDLAGIFPGYPPEPRRFPGAIRTAEARS